MIAIALFCVHNVFNQAKYEYVVHTGYRQSLIYIRAKLSSPSNFSFLFQTPNEFDEAYKELTKSGHFDYIDTGPRLYDVMWVLAVALNKTNSMVESDIPGSGMCMF